MRNTRAYLTVLSIPLLVLAGCGSDDGGDASAEDTTTAAQEQTDPGAAFAEQVNAICAESGRAMGEIFGPMSEVEGPPDEELLQSTYDALLAQVQSEQEQIEAITAPAGQEEAWDSLVAAHAEAVGVVEDQGVAYFDDEETNTFAEVEAMAADMGFEACAGGEG